MKTYELTYLISPGISSEEVGNVTKEVESFIQSKAGVILSSQKSNAQTLAYPIKKNASGYFSTVIFQSEEPTVKEIKSKLDQEKEVLRSIILVKRPVKEMKERRTRKPAARLQTESVFVKKQEEPTKVDDKDLDKKLDEMLT